MEKDNKKVLTFAFRSKATLLAQLTRIACETFVTNARAVAKATLITFAVTLTGCFCPSWTG